MTNEELNTALYKKMFAEQEKYREWVLEQPPEEILKLAYDYALREDILLNLEYNDLSDEQAQIMLKSPDAMQAFYHAHETTNTGYMEILWGCMENCANELLAQQRALYLAPPYPHDAAYAREHGQLKQFRESNQANIACKEAIEVAIREHYYDNSLHKEALPQVMGQYHQERIACVLAATCVQKDWDGRISSDNKVWAKTVPLVQGKDSTETERSTYWAVNSHPGLTDLFINMFRKEVQRQREQPARATPVSGDKRHSVLSQLSSPRPASEAAPKRKDMEL